MRHFVLQGAEHVKLPSRAVLNAIECEPQHVYFLTSGVATELIEYQDGSSSVVSIIGREGYSAGFRLLGSALSPAATSMLLDGSGYKVAFSRVEALFRRSEEMRYRILQYQQLQMLEALQSAACNNAHSAQARLARWLLRVSDSAQQAEFGLTQDFLSQMLGVYRPTVTNLQLELRRLGAIDYHHGAITILSHTILAELACDCYKASAALLRALYVDAVSPTLRRVRL